ncbi:MAG: [protein-PII] uridylyltransferase, partial [Desulfuromonadales bacterium]|nr:[protein-PII] uridylyltransferase [Desulfuromonadales bacterium]
MKHHETDFFAKELMMAGDVPFEDRRPTLLETARNYLEHHRALCQQLHQSGAGGREVVARVTEMSDVLIQSLYQCAIAEFHEAGKSCATVIALGGYGRSELNPLSDIDVMFFCSDKNKDLADQAAQRLLYLLWDLNLDVGNSVRTARDCMSLAQQDLTIRTSLLDARYITGDTDLYADFERNVLQPLLTKNTQSFLDEKFQEHETRRNKYGSSVYMLEPNLKEGEGGLRDLQTAVWMARVKFKANSLRELLTKGIISDQEMMEIEQAHDYLWNIRNHLHFLSKRKNDQLQYDKQTEIAAFLGYENNRRAPSVEQFLQDYYAHATHVEHLASTLVMRTCKSPSGSSRLMGYLARRNLGDDFFSYWGELKSARKNLFTERPEAMMLAFLLAKQNDLQLSAELKGNIRSHLELVNDKFRRSRRISGMFLQILAEPGGIARTLRDMHHLTFLNRYIPEFAKIYCKVQYDAYHVYTIDIHTIFAIEELEKLWDGVYLKKKPLFTSVARDIGKRELLVLAVLFHDIGKGEGKSHADKGADMVPKIARRFHLKKEDSERLEFLVRRHLDMAHISQRRDLNDDRLIQDFANTMGMAETLKMLFLLTFADLKAVGPDVWSEWKGFLLQELYEKTYEVLERGNFMSDVRSER